MSVDLTRLTAHLSPQQQEAVKKAYRKQAEHPTAAFLWCFFLGTFGAHRFYLRQWGAGFARLIFPLVAAVLIILGIALQWPAATVAGIAIVLLLVALIWEIIDLFRIDHEVYERNLKLAEELIASTLLTDHSVEHQALGRMEILMGETTNATGTAAQREERATAAEAAAVVPEPVAAVSETEAATPGSGETAEAAESRETESAGAGIASAEYVAHTVNEISADPNETQHSAEPVYSPEHNWTESAFVHTEDEAAQTGERSGEETVAEPGALGEAAVGIGAAAVGGFALDELATRSHEETDHSATDSLETFTTLGTAESEQRDEAAAEAEPITASAEPPTPTESEALTWPDHPPVQFDEPPSAPVAAEPESQGFDAAPLVGAALGGATLAGGAAAFIGAKHEAPAASEPSQDFTDMGTLPAAAPPIADIEGAAPLFIALPGFSTITSEDTPTLQVEPAPAAVPSADEALLLLVPDAGADQPLFEAEPLGAAGGEVAPPPDSYIPPTVPVVSMPVNEAPAMSVVTDTAPEEFDTSPVMPPPAPEPEPEATPAHSGGDTLLELAGLAGGAGLAVGAAEMLHAHSEPEPVQAAEPEVAPLGGTAPATVEEPAEPAATPLAEAAAPVEAPRHRLRRIREYLKVKHGDQETEELVAEELIEVDADPEPVRARLREQLRQQAVERGLE